MHSAPTPRPTRRAARAARVGAAAFAVAVAVLGLGLVVAGIASTGEPAERAGATAASEARDATGRAPALPRAGDSDGTGGAGAPVPTVPGPATASDPRTAPPPEAPTAAPAAGPASPQAPVTVARSGDLVLLEPWFGGPPLSVRASTASFMHDELEFSNHVAADGGAPLTDAQLWVDGYVSKDAEAGVTWERRDVGGVATYTTVSVAEEGVNVRTTLAAPSAERLVVVCSTWIGPTAPPDPGLVEVMLAGP